MDVITAILVILVLSGIMVVSFTDINAAATVADVVPQLEEDTADYMIDRYFDIVFFPVNNPEFIPSVMPLLAGLIVVAFYYGRYRSEELGWGAATSNTLIMVVTGIILLFEISPDIVSWDYLWENMMAMLSFVTGEGLAESGADPRFMVAFGIIALGLFIIVLDYYHVWPKHLAFFISSGFTVYTLTYITIAIVYEELPLEYPTFLAGVAAILSSFLFVRTLKILSGTPDD